MHSTESRAGGISLRQLFPQSRFHHAQDVRVHACCDDPERVRPGDLFVAREKEQSDGHYSAHEAVRRGAAAILAERLLPVPTPQCLVLDSHEAFSYVCQKLAGDPSQHLAMVGVSGAHGKTTTSLLAASVLKAGGCRVGYTTTLQYTDSLQPAEPLGAAPTPPELADWMARMTAAECDAAVIECPSRSLARRETAGIAFDAAILTNLRRHHLDTHGTLGNSIRAQTRLLDQLKPDGFVVINADDPRSHRLVSSLNRPVLTVGQRVEADLTATVLERDASEQTFLLTAGSESIPVRTGMIGDHHISHCLQAAAIGLIAGFDLATIARGLERIGSLPGRLERIECGQSFRVFVDEAQSPDRLAVALYTLKKVTRGRVICVFGIDAACDPHVRPLLGRVVERSADVAVVTSNNSRWEKARTIAHDILDGCEQPGRPHVLPDRSRAIEWALREARSGDCVLIAGKGSRQGETAGRRRRPFDDREQVRQTLYETSRQDDDPVILPFPTSVRAVERA